MNILRIYTSILIFFSLSAYSYAGQCHLYFDEKSGLFNISSNSVKLVEATYVFWQDNWRWANNASETGVLDQKNYEFRTSVDRLGLSLIGDAKVSDPNQLNWNFNIRASESRPNVIGGGIAFFIRPEEGAELNVQLLPDNSGWTMTGHHGCETVTVRFSNPVERLYFEQGNKHHIRAFFYDGEINAGRLSNNMSVTVPMDADYVGSLSAKLAGPDKLLWRKDILHPNYAPVDLSFLNAPEAPAGKRGFLKAQGEKLVFEDGTEGLFWGTNIQAYTLFTTSPSQIKTHAKRLSKLGFNLVRFTHNDSVWVEPNIFGTKPRTTRSLNATAFKSLDMWIKALKDEGIYIWLDLHVGREITKQDGVKNFDEIAKGRESVPIRGFNYVDEDIQSLMKEFAESYLNHVNEYTGLAYKNDPAIINILITNENDLTSHFGNGLLPDKNVPNANKIYMALAEEFAEKNNLSKDMTWRSWEHGPSKLFLNDLEHQFNVDMIAHLSQIGAKNMRSTTNTWGGMPLSSLPALTDSNILDAHSYGRPDFLKTNPNYKDNFLHWMAAAQVNGKPVSVSEWNLEPFPDTFDRFAGPVFVAATSAFQGWDALMQYGYAQQPLNNEGRPSNYTTFNDPASMAMMPAAALLYRQNHIREAEKTYALSIDKDLYFNKWIDPRNSAAIRTIMEQSKLIVDVPERSELPWFKPEKLPEDAIIIRDHNQNLIGASENSVTSDTGEITRNWKDGIYTINSPKSQIAMGWIGGSRIDLDDVSVNFTSKIAAVAVQTIDNQPINQSDDILISLSSRSEPSEGRKMPFISEPLSGTIFINAKPGLTFYVMNRYGKEIETPVDYRNGQYVIIIDRSIKSFWMALKKAPSEEVTLNQQ